MLEYEDNIEDENEEYEEYEDEKDYVTCPSCNSPVAIIYQSFGNCSIYTDYAVCPDCEYKWRQLIEPDPNNFEFEEKADYNKEFQKAISIKSFMKLDKKWNSIVEVTENIFDIEKEDFERYQRIIKYSDLSETSLNSKSVLADPYVPANIRKLRERFFQNSIMKIYDSIDNRKKQIIRDFINGSEDILNTLWALNDIGMVKHSTEADIYEYYKFNKNIDPGFEDLYALEPNISALTYTAYIKVEFVKYIEENETIEEFENKLKNKLAEFSISLFYIDSDFDKVNNGCVPINGPYLEMSEKVKKEKSEQNSQKNNENREDNIKKDMKYLNNKTTYNELTIEKLIKEIEECKPIFPLITSKPFIVTLKEFYISKYNLIFPSLIDLENEIVFLNISHENVMRKLLKLKLQDDNVDSYSKDKLDYEFHSHINSIQIFSPISGSAKILTLINKETKEVEKLSNYLKENNEKFSINELRNKEFFKVLNGKGKVEGEIYFPKPNEENIPEGKILVIPTASEEYFIPAMGNIEYNGCIITEVGSRTAHLVVNSKEFKFNLIIIKDAKNKFKENDYVSIDLDNEELKIINE